MPLLQKECEESDWNLYRTKNLSCCGVVYAELHPEQLLPEELERLKMGRPAGVKNKKASPQLSEIAEALAFIGVAATKDFQPCNTHVSLADNFAVMFDGQMSAGYPIQEELSCYPNYDMLVKAIKKCGKSLALTELDSGRLSVKGDSLRAIVPCLPPDAWAGVQPDPALAVVDDRLKAAFACCGSLADEKATRVIEASVLLEANICSGTNGKCIMQYWHGVYLPPHLVIPKIFVNAVAKVKLPIVAFGWKADTSITVYFQGGSWIRTLLYADKWPDLTQILDQPNYPKDIPDKFYEGIEAVFEFSEHGTVILADNLVKSHSNEDVGAQYPVNGLQGGKTFVGEEIAIIAPFATQMDLTTYPDRAFFTGENMRGVIMSVVMGENNG